MQQLAGSKFPSSALVLTLLSCLASLLLSLLYSGFLESLTLSSSFVPWEPPLKTKQYKLNSSSFQSSVSPSYQGEEQEVHLYYKEFSSTRHGFLGAGVVSQPLSHVWAAVSDPTLWPLYHKPIQTARLHQRVTNSISLGEPKGGMLPWGLVSGVSCGLWPGDRGRGLEAVLLRGQILSLLPDCLAKISLDVKS